MEFTKPQHFSAAVSSKEQLTANVYLVTFALPEPNELHFVAGQSLMLHIAEGVNRSMSIASLPSETHSVLMCHDVSPMGSGSKWTIGLKIGDVVSFMAPLGAFILDKESHRKKLFIATGTGVVPFRSMIRDYLENGGTDDVTLYWGLRFEKDIYWQDEFTALSQKHPNFRFVLTLSKPTEQWAGHKGRVTDHLFVHEQNLPGSDFYLCGSKEMVAEMKETLLIRSVPKEQIKTELFF